MVGRGRRVLRRRLPRRRRTFFRVDRRRFFFGASRRRRARPLRQLLKNSFAAFASASRRWRSLIMEFISGFTTTIINIQNILTKYIYI